jgi:D-serine deaminase-like pyridoxal phosphate-dependent protein
MTHSNDSWFRVENADDVPSPALLLFPERIEENLHRMIRVAGGIERLRPHMKTHKMAEVIRMQLAHGISRFKCATIAEAELTAAAGAKDVLLAYQMVGPNVNRFFELVSRFPDVQFSCVADNPASVVALSSAATRCSTQIEVLLDLDIGQHRSGIAAGSKAVELYQLIASLPGLKVGGLHAYDGHVQDTDLAARTAACDAAFAPVGSLSQALEGKSLFVPRVVAGGTPTFAIHARRNNVECSPGTCVLWDAGYGSKLPDLDFLPAAVLLTRVISKPTPTRLCLDLGHKAVAAEMPHPRVLFLDLSGSTPVIHSEEHLVIETSDADRFAPGDCLYGVPWHICPTVALHSEAVVIRAGRAVERWKVAGRERRLTI